jgi:small subunit ribosomal protein S3
MIPMHKKLISQILKDKEIEDFIIPYFDKAEVSKVKIERTPSNTRIVIYVGRKNIGEIRRRKYEDEIKEKLINQFKLLNPTIVVEEVQNSFLDAKIVAQRIKKALERGINFKKVAMYYLEKIIEAGAAGAEIRIAGKLLGKERSAAYKFRKGYILHTGHYKEEFVDVGYSQAILKVGAIGVQVRILKKVPEELMLEKWQ